MSRIYYLLQDKNFKLLNLPPNKIDSNTKVNVGNLYITGSLDVKDTTRHQNSVAIGRNLDVNGQLTIGNGAVEINRYRTNFHNDVTVDGNLIVNSRDIIDRQTIIELH